MSSNGSVRLIAAGLGHRVDSDRTSIVYQLVEHTVVRSVQKVRVRAGATFKCAAALLERTEGENKFYPITRSHAISRGGEQRHAGLHHPITP